MIEFIMMVFKFFDIEKIRKNPKKSEKNCKFWVAGWYLDTPKTPQKQPKLRAFLLLDVKPYSNLKGFKKLCFDLVFRFKM
tara:strand:+ start:23 stop:262 length:240 start_codon:yes stop_codon:yes gene_type:complete